MSKVALYFKRFKNHSRHRKLNEEWGFAISLKDFAEYPEDNEIENDSPELEIFQLKYLGSLEVESPKSEEETAAAIKKIISASKTSNKKLQRLNLSICPKGIETFDIVTGETVHQISIYKISYCSADATHSNVFAFISGDNADKDGHEKLTCYAFLCAKRKIAHKLTLTVAKNFERAYDLWQNTEQQKKYKEQSEDLKNIENLTRQQSQDEMEMQQKEQQSVQKIDCDNNKIQRQNSTKTADESIINLLIDFDADEMEAPLSIKPQQNILQNTWVSFDDEPQICENGYLMNSKAFENNMWERNVVCS